MCKPGCHLLNLTVVPFNKCPPMAVNISLFLADVQCAAVMLRWISWQCWFCSRNDVTTCDYQQHKRHPDIQGCSCEGESYLSHLNISQPLSSGWAMKVQLISDSAVCTLRTKAFRRGAGNNFPTVFPSPWSLKDTQTDNRFTGGLVWKEIKEMYTLPEPVCAAGFLIQRPICC